MIDYFAIGWKEGNREKRHISLREAITRYPQMDIEDQVLYMNGRDDGLRSDRWRLDMQKLVKALD